MFADVLKKLRAEKGISQAELAKYLNVVQQTVAKWETNVAAPGVAIMKEIAIFFDVSTDYLLEMPHPFQSSYQQDYPKELYLHINKYCAISSNGKAIVDATLDTIWKQEHKFDIEKKAIS